MARHLARSLASSRVQNDSADEENGGHGRREAGDTQLSSQNGPLRRSSRVRQTNASNPVALSQNETSRRMPSPVSACGAQCDAYLWC